MEMKPQADRPIRWGPSLQHNISRIFWACAGVAGPNLLLAALGTCCREGTVVPTLLWAQAVSLSFFGMAAWIRSIRWGRGRQHNVAVIGFIGLGVVFPVVVFIGFIDDRLLIPLLASQVVSLPMCGLNAWAWFNEPRQFLIHPDSLVLAYAGSRTERIPFATVSGVARVRRGGPWSHDYLEHVQTEGGGSRVLHVSDSSRFERVLADAVTSYHNP